MYMVRPIPWATSTKLSHPVTFIFLKDYNPQQQNCRHTILLYLKRLPLHRVFSKMLEHYGYLIILLSDSREHLSFGYN